MRPPHHVRARRGWSLIEITITAGVVAILAAVALPSIDFNRFRMDGAARQVQLRFLAAQSSAVQKNAPYMVTFFFTRDQFRVTSDNGPGAQKGNGLWDGGVETRNWFSLPENIHFMVPPSTIDGASADYATGPGLHGVSSGGVFYPTMNFYPNGSSSGDVVVYMGTKSTRYSDFRAIQLTGSTSKARYWRMMTDGQWKLGNM